MTEVAVSSERKNFSKIRSFMDLPNLIDVQRRSYERFLQMNLLPEEREESGLQAVFTSVFPFTDFRGACELQFVRYSIGNWECKCGRLKGLEHLRMECRHCGKRIVTAREGVFLEQLETNPAQYVPDIDEHKLSGHVVHVDLNRPMSEIRKTLSQYPIKTRLALSGPLIVARDLAHAKLRDALERGEGLPDYVKNHPIYYAGPAKTPAGT